MGIGFLNIGMSGLQAASMGLSTTNHNITNANSPGYSRQNTVQAATWAHYTGNGSLGQGTEVTTVKRAYDQFVNKQLNTAQSTYSYFKAYNYEVVQIDNLLADETSGLSPVLQKFFSSVQDLANNPSETATRQAMVSSAQSMVSGYKTLQHRLDELNEEVNGKIEVAISKINSISEQIADVSRKIHLTEAAYAQPANDLRDQRDALVRNLNELIDVKTVQAEDGTFSVFMGSGQRLVSSFGELTRLTAERKDENNSRLTIGLETANGGAMELPEHLIRGGELGGLLAFRSETMDTANNELGRIAASLALVFNAQHAKGQDLLGNKSGDAGFENNFFDMANMQPLVTSYSSNKGNGIVNAQFTAAEFGPETTNGNYYTMLTTSDYRLTCTGANANGVKQYQLLRLSDNTILGTGDEKTLNELARKEGFSLNITGDAQENDQFLIRPTANAVNNLKINESIVADPRLIAAALPFGVAANPNNTGGGTITESATSPLAPNGKVTLPVTITYDKNELTIQQANGQITYKAAGAATETKVAAGAKIPYTQGMRISIDGMVFTLSGQPNNGDSFTLNANNGATTDSRNALALGQLQTQNTVGGHDITNDNHKNDKGTTTLQGSYAQMVAFVGIKANEVAVGEKSQLSVLNQAQANQESLAGVNLDEEYVNMIKYQQAYQASARIIEVAGIVFDTIINMRR